MTWNPDAHGDLAGFLERLERPIAVFAACDRIAAAALAELQEGKVPIPEQVAVLGVDDDRLICQSARPTLSSIRPGHYDEGVMAARKLNALMNARKPRSRQTILCTKMDLAERASTAFVAPAARLISAAREFIEQNAVRGITPNDVAHHLGISRRLLDLRFGELNDVSVSQMIRATKLTALAERKGRTMPAESNHRRTPLVVEYPHDSQGHTRRRQGTQEGIQGARRANHRAHRSADP